MLELDVRELAVGSCLPFRFKRRAGGAEEEAFLLRLADGLVAFTNNCPHWNVDLDLGFGDPFDPSSQMIGCRNHGALFEPRTGLCVAGPCRGQRLEMLPVNERDGTAHVAVPLSLFPL